MAQFSVGIPLAETLENETEKLGSTPYCLLQVADHSPGVLKSVQGDISTHSCWAILCLHDPASAQWEVERNEDRILGFRSAGLPGRGPADGPSITLFDARGYVNLKGRLILSPKKNSHSV